MRSFLFGVGVILLIAGAACGIAEVLHLTAGGSLQRVSLGSIWFSIHANSLVGFQALVEKSISPMVWAPIQVLLTAHAWLVLVPLGGLLVLVCRPRNRGFAGR